MQAANASVPVTAPLSIALSPVSSIAPTGPIAAASLPPPASAVPDTAGITSAYAAAVPIRNRADTQIFHGLFADISSSPSGAPALPVARTAPPTGPLWSVPGSSAAGAAAPPPAAVAANFLDLFKDTADGS
jgi:hypothetical protein